MPVMSGEHDSLSIISAMSMHVHDVIEVSHGDNTTLTGRHDLKLEPQLAIARPNILVGDMQILTLWQQFRTGKIQNR